MKILVIASKKVGLECVKFLINDFPNDHYTFVACDPDAGKIVTFLKKEGHVCSIEPLKTLEAVSLQPEGDYDWLLNLWGGVIYKQNVLSRARRSLNIHPAYLPYGRGRDPVVWAIRNNEPAGLSFHALTKKIDEGPIWYQERVNYTIPCRGEELYDRIIDRCSEAFIEQWPSLRETRSDPVPQDVTDHDTKRRKDLVVDRNISIDDDLSVRDFVLKLMAHDFGSSYTARLNIDGNVFNATLNLRSNSDKT